MIATSLAADRRFRRLVRHARHLVLRLPPGHSLLLRFPEPATGPALHPPDLRALSPGSPALVHSRRARTRRKDSAGSRPRRRLPGRQNARYQES